MKDYDLETLNEVKEWLNDDTFSNKTKVESIATRLFIELSDEQKLDLFYNEGDDFEFYLKFVNEIDFDSYDGNCIVEMTELILKKFLSMQTFSSDDLIKLCKLIVIQNI